MKMLMEFKRNHNSLFLNMNPNDFNDIKKETG